MAKAARLNDPASHMTAPIAPGAASADVNIGGAKAWRGLPAGLGAGIEQALEAMKQLIDAPFLDPVTTPITLTQVFAGLMQDAVRASSQGSPAAPGTTAGEFGKLALTNAQQTATYIAAAAVPGGQPAALTAYTQAMKKAAADFAGAAVEAIAGMTDVHNCPQPSGPIPHGPGVVTKGSRSVFINGLPACRQGDKLFEAAGGADPIAKGCPSVNIGDDGGPGDAAGVDDLVMDLAETLAEAVAALAERIAHAPLSSAAPTGTILRALASVVGGRGASAPAGRTNQSRRGDRHRFIVRVVQDQSGAPIPGVNLQLALSDGRSVSRATDADGMIEIVDIQSAGACTITCAIDDARLATTHDFVALGASRVGPPADLYDRAPDGEQPHRGGVIADVEAHQVQTGETLDGLARQAGMTWQQLANFNWNTSNPDDINRHLRDDVGCRRTTRDGCNSVFDSTDRPGIVYIPRQWEQSGLAVDQVHTIRVRSLGFASVERRMRLFDSFARAMPGAPYAVEVGGSEVSRGLADENGDILLTAALAEACTVRWGRAEAANEASESPAGYGADEADARFLPDSEYEFSREIFVEIEEAPAGDSAAAADAARKRLSNMGYTAGDSLADNVCTFQRDTGRSVTGQLADVLDLVCEHHDEQCQPPDAARSAAGLT